MFNADVVAYVLLVLVSLALGVITGLASRAMDRADRTL
jgi:hypothetical protein